MSDVGFTLNASRDTAFAHADKAFGSVLFLAHRDWHGVRSATACLPGHKLAITHERELTDEEIRFLEGFLFTQGITTVCIQGYSKTADALARRLKDFFKDRLRLYQISHVSPAQLEYTYEVEMIDLIISGLREGIYSRIGSVKPGFHMAYTEFWDETIINTHPNNVRHMRVARKSPTAIVPLPYNWRKNLITNILACEASRVLCEYYLLYLPEYVKKSRLCKKAVQLSFLTPGEMMSALSLAGVALNVTLAECQPMTLLEALAVGTPCLTGPLALPGLEQHPLTDQLTVRQTDNVAEVAQKIDRLLTLDTKSMQRLMTEIDDYLAVAHSLSIRSYRRFFDL